MATSTALVMKQANAIARARMGGGRRRKHRRAKTTIPLGIVAGFIPLGVGIWNRKSAPASIGPYVLGSLTGYVPGHGFNAGNMAEGSMPILAGFVAHWVAGRLGVNRALGRARLPLFRI